MSLTRLRAVGDAPGAMKAGAPQVDDTEPFTLTAVRSITDDLVEVAIPRPAASEMAAPTAAVAAFPPSSEATIAPVASATVTLEAPLPQPSCGNPAPSPSNSSPMPVVHGADFDPVLLGAPSPFGGDVPASIAPYANLMGRVFSLLGGR